MEREKERIDEALERDKVNTEKEKNCGADRERE